MKAVCNASPLIFLSKLDRLHILGKLYSAIVVPREVELEVLKDPEKHFEAPTLREALQKKPFRIAKAAKRPDFPEFGMDKGEIAVLQIALEENIKAVILDDKNAIRAAKLLNLEPASCPFLLLSALKRQILTYNEFKGAFDQLLSFNYRISPPLYGMILEKAKEIS